MPESPKLNAVQAIVDRLEAQNSPQQWPSHSSLSSPVQSISPFKVVTNALSARRLDGLPGIPVEKIERAVHASDKAKALEVTEPQPNSTASKQAKELSRMKPPEGAACTVSTCTVCREAKHELKTLACKVAGPHQTTDLHITRISVFRQHISRCLKKCLAWIASVIHISR